MGQILTVHPTIPAERQTVTLGGARYDLRLTWRDRTASWYADLWDATGAPIWLGQRVTPGWGLGTGLVVAGEPDGIFVVRGPSDFERLDLGAAVKIAFYPTSELPTRTSTDYGLTITIP
jgi:hypothetical protein